MNLKLFRKDKPTAYRLTASTYKHFSRLRIVGFIFSAFFALLIIATSLFTYLTVYKTLGEISVADIVSRGVGVEIIDFSGLEAVEAAWATKHAARTPNITLDPFYPSVPVGTVPLAGSRPATIPQPSIAF